jgi:glutamine synthetase
VRIPHVTNINAKRIEVRFPDPTANPYLGLAAMLMAGLDGIKNKIHPGNATDKNLFHDKNHNLGADQVLCGSLQEALSELNNNRSFLLQGDVFTNAQIDAYIALKEREVAKFNQAPHPLEFQMYYSH